MSSPYFPLPAQMDPGQIPPYGVYGYNNWGGFTPGGSPQNASMNFGTALGQGGQLVDPNASMEQIYAAQRSAVAGEGDVLGGIDLSQLNYYQPQQEQYTQAENAVLNNLAQTPGFTPQQAGQINVDYSQFNTAPGAYSNMAGNPNAPVNTVGQGIGAEGAMLNAYQSNLGSQVGQLGQGLQAAQGQFGGLNTAVSNPMLGFDPNQTEKQMTNQDVQNIVTAAGTQVGNQFQTAEDTLRMQAAAAGNTSPAAEAAARQALVTQEASSAGDAMTNARIQALQAQYQRAAGIEQQREGAVQTQAGLQATAATTEEAAAQAAAGMAGQAGIGAAENYGQFSTGEENTMTGQLYGAQSTAEQLAAQRAQQIAQMQYEQGIGSAQLTAGGAQTVGAQEIAGEAALRAGLAQEQGAAQQGGESAMANAANVYGTSTSGTGAATTGQGNFEVGKFSAGDYAAKMGLTNLLGPGGWTSPEGVTTASQMGNKPVPRGNAFSPGPTPPSPTQPAPRANVYNPGQYADFNSQLQRSYQQEQGGQTPATTSSGGSSSTSLNMAEGGIAFEPTIARLGEKGPELVMPVGRYKSERYRKAA